MSRRNRRSRRRMIRRMKRGKPVAKRVNNVQGRREVIAPLPMHLGKSVNPDRWNRGEKDLIVALGSAIDAIVVEVSIIYCQNVPRNRKARLRRQPPYLPPAPGRPCRLLP